MNIKPNDLKMKRILLITLTLLGAILSVSAQSDLQIGRVFGGKYGSDPSVTETMMSGDQRFLRSNRLANFATFKGDAKTYAPIIQPLVLADGAKAIGRNVRYKEGKLQYAFFMLKPVVADGRKLNRYLYYITSNKGSNPYVMVIYFDGPLSRQQGEALISKMSNK